MKKVTQEQAEKEIDSWLDYKRIRPKKREAAKAQVDLLVESVMYGELVLDSKTHVLTHKLSEPLGGDNGVEKLEYKPRLLVKDVHAKTSNVDPSDADGRVLAYVSAITGQNKELLRNMDSSDYSISQAIAIFFI